MYIEKEKNKYLPMNYYLYSIYPTIFGLFSIYILYIVHPQKCWFPIAPMSDKY